MECDLAVDRELELRGLDTTEGRVAVGELPLLSDHLDRQHLARGLKGGVWSLATASSGVGKLDGAKDGEEQHDDRRYHQPGDLDPAVVADGDTFLRLDPGA